MFDNFVDVTVICLQVYAFLIKFQDGKTFDIDPMKLLEQENRMHFNTLCFISNNFRNYCIMETVGLIFVATKVIDGARLAQRINVIALTLNESVSLLGIFMGFLIMFNVALVPLAMAIWGTYLVGYKTKMETLNSVFMIAYSKGNLEKLLDINFIWSFNFMLIYYVVAIFILHAAFHMIQTDALKNVVMLYSLQEDDVVDENKEEKKDLSAKDLKKMKIANDNAMKKSFINSLQWVFGWTGPQNVKKIGQLYDQLAVEYRSSEDEDEDGGDDEEGG